MTNNCLICNKPIEPFMSFGMMPLANGFLTPSQFSEEYYFDLSVASCCHCGMFQLTEQPEREKMFNEKYPFFSGTSKDMETHFEEFARHIKTNYLSTGVPDPFVVEIGSNDGIMLRHFAAAGMRHVGIEPSANVAKVAMDNGINTLCAFFDEECAHRIVRQYGQADIFFAANVMCHIPSLHSIVQGIRILLKPKGIVIFEDPYLGDVVENISYDQIYDEHVFLFSLSSISYLFRQHDMDVIDVEPQETHGGSMRYIIACKGAYAVSDAVDELIEREREIGLGNAQTYQTFRRSCELSRDALMTTLNNIRRQGKRIVGYAATSKSTTIINYCGITADHIEYISDTTPVKQGKYSPGAHIPVRSHEEFVSRYPDYALLFAYNHAKEIMAKERKFIENGGKWITYVPNVRVL